MIRLVVTTFADADDAARVVRLLVEERLAACGTILPGARSIYAWEGAVEDAAEVVVIFKSTASALSALEARLKAIHPYKIPEIIALDPASVSGDYAAWVAAHCLS